MMVLIITTIMIIITITYSTLASFTSFSHLSHSSLSFIIPFVLFSIPFCISLFLLFIRLFPFHPSFHIILHSPFFSTSLPLHHPSPFHAHIALHSFLHRISLYLSSFLPSLLSSSFPYQFFSPLSVSLSVSPLSVSLPCALSKHVYVQL